MATPFTYDLMVLLVRELEGFQREVELFPDDESLWRTVPGVANSAGNLALHVAGNLRTYVGATLGRTGYVRNRENEFGQRSGTRQQVVAELAHAITTVRGVLPTLSPEELDAPLVQAGSPEGVPAHRFLMHLAVHAGFHLGQAGYLRRIVTGSTQSSGPINTARLVD
jgi:hypothetical protein